MTDERIFSAPIAEAFSSAIRAAEQRVASIRAAEDIEPALTAEEWATLAAGKDYLLPNIDDVGLDSIRRDDLPRTIAYVNAKLPDDSPYKITRGMERAVRSIADTNLDWQENRANEHTGRLFLRIANTLNALLPPEK